MPHSDVYHTRLYVRVAYEPSVTPLLNCPKLTIPKSLLKRGKRVFHQFPRLPSDIRNLIWTFVLVHADPRGIELDCYFHEWTTAFGRTVRLPMKTVVPTPFLVCSEARIVALKI